MLSGVTSAFIQARYAKKQEATYREIAKLNARREPKTSVPSIPSKERKDSPWRLQ